MKIISSLSKLSLFTLLLVGCAGTPELRMEAQRPPYDESVTAPSLATGSFKKIMVIPPSGTVRGQYDILIALFEREFLRGGITVISGAITGRVVLENSTEKKSEHSQDLSDAERALVMAKSTGADAILQIGEWTWSSETTPKRFFIFSETGKNYGEVTRIEYQGFTGKKLAFPSSELRFVGRLTNVLNGEVIASFEIKSPANFNLPGRYVASVEEKGDQPVIVAESYRYGGGTWLEESKKTTEAVVIATVCDRILKREPPKTAAPAAVPATQPMAPTSEASKPGLSPAPPDAKQEEKPRETASDKAVKLTPVKSEESDEDAK